MNSLRGILTGADYIADRPIFPANHIDLSTFLNEIHSLGGVYLDFQSPSTT